jgi:hypothetical protein
VGTSNSAWYDEAGNVYVARTKEEAMEQAKTVKLMQDAMFWILGFRPRFGHFRRSAGTEKRLKLKI